MLFGLFTLPWASRVMAKESPATAEYRAAMQRMHQAMPETYSGDVDADFVIGMIPHHQAAVEMARTELRYGSDLVIRDLAKNILAAQEREIAEMKRWSGQKGVRFPAPDSPAIGEYRTGMHRMHSAMMQTAYTNHADRDFVQGMIPHHQGAVDMAATELKYGRDPEITALADGIARSQTQEIMLMQGWLKKMNKQQERGSSL